MTNRIRYSDFFEYFLCKGACSYCVPIHEGVMSELYMLPQYHITDFPHYGRVFGELLGELTRLTAAGSEIAAAAIRQAETSAVLFFAILALGAVFGAAAIIMESVSIKAKGGKHYKK